DDGRLDRVDRVGRVYPRAELGVAVERLPAGALLPRLHVAASDRRASAAAAAPPRRRRLVARHAAARRSPGRSSLLLDAYRSPRWSSRATITDRPAATARRRMMSRLTPSSAAASLTLTSSPTPYLLASQRNPRAAGGA